VAIRALVAFLVMFGILRAITAIIHYELFPHGPFRYVVTRSGLHIHHLFWGVLLLMVTGFAAIATRAEQWHLRIAVVFGIALALTLDEFARMSWRRTRRMHSGPCGMTFVCPNGIVEQARGERTIVPNPLCELPHGLFAVSPRSPFFFRVEWRPHRHFHSCAFVRGARRPRRGDQNCDRISCHHVHGECRTDDRDL